MKNLNKNICLQNIYYLAKQRDIPIGVLEREAGVSLGYFSRLLKDKNNSLPSVEVLVSVASYLSISLNNLIFLDLTGVDLTETEKYLISFLENLIQLTKKNKINWIKESVRDREVYIQQHRFSEMPSYYLFETHGLVQWAFDSYPSLFCDSTFSRYDDFFYFDDSNVRYFLTKVFTSKIDNSSDEYELYLIEDEKREKICASTGGAKEIFKTTMSQLYEEVCNFIKAPKIEQNVKSRLDVFMRLHKENKT